MLEWWFVTIKVLLLPFSRKKFHQAFGPLEVEDLAAAWALEFAAELGITDAVLEGDSLMLSQALKKKKKKNFKALFTKWNHYTKT